MARRDSRSQGSRSKSGKSEPRHAEARDRRSSKRSGVKKTEGLRDQRPSKREDQREASQSRPVYASARKDGVEYLEGHHSVMEAMYAGVPLKGIMVASSMLNSDRSIDGVLAAAKEREIPVRVVGRDLLDELSSHGAHQGIIAEARPFRYASLPDVLERAGSNKNALVVICDHVTDPGNLGAIIRSAEVVGAAGVIIPNRRAAQVNAHAYKASAGAVSHIPICKVPNLTSAIEELKDQGFWAVAATEHAESSVWQSNMSGRIALVMGNEGDGISRLVLEHCDLMVKLPQRGVIESLNVAQSATVLMYEWLRCVTLDEE